MDNHSNRTSNISAQPHLHQRAAAIQPYGTVNHALPLELEEPVRLEMTERLNQLLADTITIRDLYKKSHWQVAGASYINCICFSTSTTTNTSNWSTLLRTYPIAGRCKLAMAADVAEETRIERPPRGREEVPVQLSRLLDAHQVIIREARTLARRATQLATTAPMT